MNRTAAPASAKAFALVSVLVTALALVVSLGVVFLQNLLKGSFSSDPGILAIFSFPALSFLVRFLPVLLMAVFCIVILAGGRRPVWSKGKAAAFAAVMAVVYVLFSLLEMPVETLEAQLVAAQGGSAQLVAYSVVRSMLNWGYGLLRYSAVAAFVSISVLTYQAAVDARAPMPQYTGGNT